MLSACAVCVLVGGGGELKAQGLVKRKHSGVGLRESDLKKRYLKPELGAYHSKEITTAYRVEGLGLSFVGYNYSSSYPYDLFLSRAFLGFGAGVKIPVPTWQSQIIPMACVYLGIPINRIEMSVECRSFLLGHAKDEKYDWGSPWVGLGASAGYRPVAAFDNDSNPLHYGIFTKIGWGFLAFFIDIGLSPLLNSEGTEYISDVASEPSLTHNSTSFRYGLVLEI